MAVGLWLYDWEIDMLNNAILRAYIAGAVWDDEGAWNEVSWSEPL